MSKFISRIAAALLAVGIYSPASAITFFATPASFDFGTVEVGSSSASQTFTITLQFDSLEVPVGVFPGLPVGDVLDFVTSNQSPSCATTLNGCSFDVVFTPTSSGSKFVAFNAQAHYYDFTNPSNLETITPLIISVTGLAVDPNTPIVTPVPAALPLFASGLAALGFIVHRRRKRV